MQWVPGSVSAGEAGPAPVPPARPRSHTWHVQPCCWGPSRWMPHAGRGLSPWGSTLPSPCFTPAPASNAVLQSTWAGGSAPAKAAFSPSLCPLRAHCRSPHPPRLTPARPAQPAFALHAQGCWVILPQDHPLLPPRATAHRKAKNPNK